MGRIRRSRTDGKTFVRGQRNRFFLARSGGLLEYLAEDGLCKYDITICDTFVNSYQHV